MPNSKDSRTAPETQAKKRWTPPGGTLGRLIRAASERAAGLQPRSRELEERALAADPAPSLAQALATDHVGLIAEVKRSSPSRGAIRPELDAERQAAAYQRGGAAAISVLTEPDEFGGSDADMAAAIRGAGLPTLRKDFHVSAVQLFQARCLGASAALLIARALEPSLFSELVEVARAIDLGIVAEVRDMAEMDRAITAGARIIGVNNRNLETLAIERGTAEALMPQIPRGIIAIAESGYADKAAIERAAAAGADAVLVGSFLSVAADPAAEVARLAGVRKVTRGG